MHIEYTLAAKCGEYCDWTNLLEVEQPGREFCKPERGELLQLRGTYYEVWQVLHVPDENRARVMLANVRVQAEP